MPWEVSLAKYKEVGEKLADGWEPYAAYNDYGTIVVHLRRYVEEEQ